MYSRPNKPLFIPVKRRDEPKPLDPVEIAQPVTVDKATECHVTPHDVAARMVHYLGPSDEFSTLEPSAGTGQLARALIDKGHNVVMVERHIGLANQLYELGPTINRCFLEYAEENQGTIQFPRILMNPPFSKCRQHIKAALSLLSRPGKLVALVPITFELEGAETLEHLPDTTFATAKVRTKVISYEHRNTNN